jgi:hypothetical protein
VPKKQKPKKKPHQAPLNLSGIKFEDAVRKLLNAPPSVGKKLKKA